MKRTFNYLLAFVIAAMAMVSCLPEEDFFDEGLLIGKWRSGTEYYRYDDGGTGVSWDTSDDVTEEEGQAYTWTLERSELTHIHVVTVGGGVPKVYTVTQLTTTTLKYKDDFNNTFSFVKVN